MSLEVNRKHARLLIKREGHPAHNPNPRQRPLRFEDGDLSGSTLTRCDLSKVEISCCNIAGLKINDFRIEDLLK